MVNEHCVLKYASIMGAKSVRRLCLAASAVLEQDVQHT